MPFGVKRNDIVIIDRTTGTRAHLVSRDLRGDLITHLAAGHGVDITDAAGDHHYPSAAVLGLHFETAPWYADATVQLWQDRYGIGQPATPGAARLYLVDPEQPDTAWPIHQRWIRPNRTFRAVAGQIIEGVYPLAEIADNGVLVSNLEQGAHVATWHHGNGHVEIITEHRMHAPGLVPVAGAVAVTFIGLEDMNAEARNR